MLEHRGLTPLRIRDRLFDWGARTFMMGIINVTPDSFSGDGIDDDIASVAEQALEFEKAGADIIDIGGESTRPGHVPVAEDEELRRVVPAVAAVRKANSGIPISIDTFKPRVAIEALEAGADIMNCVWGALPAIIAVAADSDAPIVIMHNRTNAEYHRDCVDEVIESLTLATKQATDGGVGARNIIVDPGIGFGKTADHNVEILSRLDEFTEQLRYPLLVGVSRKSFIGKITGLPVTERVFGTAAAVALSIAGGADIVRVHDVKVMRAVVDVADAICRTGAARPPERLSPGYHL